MHPVSSPSPDHTVRVLQALGNPLRFRVMRLLAGLGADGPGNDPCEGCEIVCACRLRLLLQVSAPDLSHHINVLKAVGLIESCREGKLIYYRAKPDTLLSILPVLEELAVGKGEIRSEPRNGD